SLWRRELRAWTIVDGGQNQIGAAERRFQEEAASQVQAGNIVKRTGVRRIPDDFEDLARTGPKSVDEQDVERAVQRCAAGDDELVIVDPGVRAANLDVENAVSRLREIPGDQQGTERIARIELAIAGECGVRNVHRAGTLNHSVRPV